MKYSQLNSWEVIAWKMNNVRWELQTVDVLMERVDVQKAFFNFENIHVLFVSIWWCFDIHNQSIKLHWQNANVGIWERNWPCNLFTLCKMRASQISWLESIRARYTTNIFSTLDSCWIPSWEISEKFYQTFWNLTEVDKAICDLAQLFIARSEKKIIEEQILYSISNIELMVWCGRCEWSDLFSQFHSQSRGLGFSFFKQFNASWELTMIIIKDSKTRFIQISMNRAMNQEIWESRKLSLTVA